MSYSQPIHYLFTKKGECSEGIIYNIQLLLLLKPYPKEGFKGFAIFIKNRVNSKTLDPLFGVGFFIPYI